MKPNKRWKNGNGYITQQYFYRAIQKYGWENFKHEILHEGLSKEEAEQKEIELISYYDSTNKNKGYNISHGGNCSDSVSEETRKKISESLKGKKQSEETINKRRASLKGRIFSEEHREKLSKANKGKRPSDECIQKSIGIRKGVPLSKDTKKKIGDSLRGVPRNENTKRKIGKANSVAICQYSQDGTLIKTWNSCCEVERILNIANSSISKCCQGKSKKAGGFIWRYENEALTIEHLQWCNSKDANCGKNKCVAQYTSNNVFIAEYNSIKNASELTGINKSSISNCCRGVYDLAGGYIWKYKE